MRNIDWIELQLDRNLRCIFIGYSTEQQGWKVYDVNTSKTHVSRDVKFDESRFTLASALSTHKHEQKQETYPPDYDGSESYITTWTSSDERQQTKHLHFDTYFKQVVLPE